MALSKIISKLTLGQWLQTDIDGFNYCYLIAVKGTKQASDTIDPKDVRRITLEIGIDCGVVGKPLTIQRVNINFNDEISPNNELNDLVRAVRLTNVPNEFYIKVVSVDDGKKEITEGSVSIEINVNSMQLV